MIGCKRKIDKSQLLEIGRDLCRHNRGRSGNNEPQEFSKM
jgi:hypothetical protein